MLKKKIPTLWAFNKPNFGGHFTGQLTSNPWLWKYKFPSAEIWRDLNFQSPSSTMKTIPIETINNEDHPHWNNQRLPLQLEKKEPANSETQSLNQVDHWSTSYQSMIYLHL